MDAEAKIVQSILKLWPIASWLDSTIVVACSGGADSTALLEVLHTIRKDTDLTIVAHYNHALRGHESDADQASVESQSSKLGLRCISKRASAIDATNHSENSLRKLRHQFLSEVAASHNAKWIAMAHQADDQVETFLHHLLRGSGPSGLSGIQTFRAIDSFTQIVRPLLRVHRSEINAFLEEKQQSFCVDRSNALPDYTRNRIRNELLPALRSFANSDSLDRRLLQARELIAEEHAVFKDLADRWLAKIGYAAEEALPAATGNEKHSSHFSVSLPMCRNEPWPIIREAMVMIWHRMNWPLREMNHHHWRKVQRLIELASQTTHPKRLELPGLISVTSRKGVLRIEQTNPTKID